MNEQVNRAKAIFVKVKVMDCSQDQKKFWRKLDKTFLPKPDTGKLQLKDGKGNKMEPYNSAVFINIKLFAINVGPKLASNVKIQTSNEFDISRISTSFLGIIME